MIWYASENLILDSVAMELEETESVLEGKLRDKNSCYYTTNELTKALVKE